MLTNAKKEQENFLSEACAAIAHSDSKWLRREVLDRITEGKGKRYDSTIDWQDWCSHYTQILELCEKYISPSVKETSHVIYQNIDWSNNTIDFTKGNLIDKLKQCTFKDIVWLEFIFNIDLPTFQHNSKEILNILPAADFRSSCQRYVLYKKNALRYSTLC